MSTPTLDSAPPKLMRRKSPDPGLMPTPSAAPIYSKRKVLVLEDDDAFRAFLQRLLNEQGYEVVTALNGVEGVHHILAHDFYAILCDMVMPTLPGDMFYRAVERMRPHLCRRFVFMTGQYEQAKVKEFLSTTGGTMLLKPFHIDDLREMLAFVELRNLHLAN